MKGELGQILAIQRDAHTNRQALSERSGSNIGVRRNVWVRVSFEAAAELPQGHQLFVGDRARRLEHGIQEGAGMALAENQVVIARRVRVLPVILQVLRHQNGHQVRRRHRRGRMP